MESINAVIERSLEEESKWKLKHTK
jgi:hypothetical protein